MVYTVELTLKIRTELHCYSPAEKIKALFFFGSLRDALSDAGLEFVSVKTKDIATDSSADSLPVAIPSEQHLNHQHMSWEDDGGK